MQRWVVDHFVLLSVLSGVTVVAGLVGAVVVAVALPEDFFVKPTEHRHGKGLAKKVLKNVVGLVAIVAGFVMALPLVPGIIVMLVGFSMADSPGKRKVEVKLLRVPGVSMGLNELRKRFGRAPLRLPNTSRNPPSLQPSHEGTGG